MSDLNTAWLVWSFEHDAWWRADSAGYTQHLVSAGIYSEAEARAIAEDSTLPKSAPREKAMTLHEALEAERSYASRSPFHSSDSVAAWLLDRVASSPLTEGSGNAT